MGATEQPLKKKRVAVVGSGITGLSTAWLLQRSGAEVVLFEKEATCGGHTLTNDSGTVPVDLGFQVYNLTTYPNLVGLLDTLGVDTEPSDMSFAVSSDEGAFEWGSRGLGALFAQRRNILSPTFWRMVADVVHFGRNAPEVLNPSNAAEFGAMSTGDYLRRRRYSTVFVRHYFLPMCAAVWSVPVSQMMRAPIVTLVRFWANHHLLDLVQRPVWRVVKGRSRSYVDAICAELCDVRAGCGVAAVESLGKSGPVRLRTEGGATEKFDAVVLATHTDTSLAMLGDACPQEAREVLAAIPYNENDVWLHTDASLMPRARAAWASWNFLGSSASGSEDAAVCVSYWLNLLQNLPPGTPDMFVTLNPPRPPATGSVLRRLAHPVFGPDMVAAQAALPGVQGKGGVYLAGAWAGYGFHEDGLKAGIAVAQALGATLPWRPRAANPKVGLFGLLAMSIFDRFARAAISVGHLRVILPSGEELSYGDPATTQPPVVPGEEWRGRPKQAAVIRLFDHAFFRKIITRHDTGMGESYMDGDYEVDDIGGLLAIACANATNIEDSRGLLGFLNTLGGWALRAAHAARSNTIAGSRRNIEEHYDAGNDMYRLFLDNTLTYSCGIHSPGGSLQDAQLAKLDAMLQTAEVCATDHVLEIGCGWGSMAIRAVQTTGCRWTGITVSKEQLAEATARVKVAGLSDSITLLFCDYREIPAAAGSFDKVLSCEMIEAVGQEHLVTYFTAINAALKPGGKAVIQVIAEPDERYETYCASSDFIREHIFPGGHLPSMGAMVQAARGTTLQVQGCRDIGLDYAITLRDWRAAWEEKREAVLQLGYSDRFWRKYRFYFAYCEAAFDARYIHDFQVLFVKGDAGDATAAAAAAAGATLAQAVAEPSSSRRSAPDPFTQTLLGIYFFLAGWAVGQRRALLLMPVVSALCAALLWLASALSAGLSPRFRGMDPEAKVWWCTDVVHLLYSAGVSVSAATYLVLQPGALSVASPPVATGVPDALVCISAGFCAFLLWILLAYRIYSRSYMKMLHLTTTLVLLASAAHKSDHTALMTAALVSEAHTAFFLARRMQDALGVAAASSWRRTVAQAERASLVVFRLAPHAALTAAVVAQPGGFATRVRYGMACGGLLYMNFANVLKARRTFGGAAAAAAAKPKAQ